MNQPTISILMPVKNAEEWINETINSIVDQSFESWELIAIDDHSTDSSWNILEEWSLLDKRIRCFKNNAEGIISALKQAFDQSNGAYITRMDADDIMPKQKLEWFLKAQNPAKKTIVTGLVEYFSDERVSEGYVNYQHWLNDRCKLDDHWKWIYRECVIASANWLIKREHFDLSENQYPEDYDLVFHWYNQGFEIVTIPEITHLWREHPKRTSRNNQYYQQKAFFQLKIKWFLKTDFDNKKSLVLVGNNQKSRLVKKILETKSIPFKVFEEKQLSELNTNTHQILICVYPSEKQRKLLENFIKKKGFLLGQNYWYV